MLRVFLTAPPHEERADRWVRYDSEGRAIGRGDDVPSHWPDDSPIDVVLAAGQARLIALALPPMPHERVRGAARYALEDQIAATADDVSIAVTDVRDGRCLAAVASTALIRTISTQALRVARIVPESALAPKHDGWTWHVSGAGDGFVRRADGSAFTVSTLASDDGALPGEIAAALGQARRADVAPSIVHVAFPAEPSRLTQWSQTVGVRFVAAPAWHWEHASAVALDGAPDFLRDAARAAPGTSRSSTLRAFRPAAILAGLAAGIYLAGLVLESSWLGIENWRLSHALVAEATAAQLPDASTAPTAMAAIARQNATLRHRAWQAAPADALPLLARAAPSLATLPPGTLRAARYAGDAWTLELGKLDPPAVSRISRALADAGVDALAAPTPAGTRMRLSLAPTAR